MHLKDLLKTIHRVAPPELAYDWDNSGLQAGSLNQKIKKIGFALDATEKTLNAAAHAKCDLLLTHHPLIFKPLKKIDFENYPGSLIAKAANLGISIFSAHTNWDNASKGVAKALADKLSLDNREALESISSKFLKLIVFVPSGYENKVKEALFDAACGTIGDYERCWYAGKGEGGFKVPLGAQAFIGEKGNNSRTQESRLELILPASLAANAALAIRKSHPYEEPAFEFHSIKVPVKDEGLGLLAFWPEKRNLLAELQKAGFFNYKWAGLRPNQVKKIALLPGSGGNFLSLAKARGAEVLITGDSSYHHALEAESLKITLVDIGHYESEWPGVERLAQVLREEFDKLEEEEEKIDCLVLNQSGAWNYTSDSKKLELK